MIRKTSINVNGYTPKKRNFTKANEIEVIGSHTRADGTSIGMRSVDGFYLVKERGMVRQIRFYDVKTDEEAVRLAKEDGLFRGILLEVMLTNPIGPETYCDPRWKVYDPFSSPDSRKINLAGGDLVI